MTLREHVLFIANYTKLYRHFFYANYYIFNVKDKVTVPLVESQIGGTFGLYLFPAHQLTLLRHSICHLVTIGKHHRLCARK